MVATVVHAATVAIRADEGSAAVVETSLAARNAPELVTAKAFLLARPWGVYTCARAVPTNGGRRLVLWPFHLARLSDGLHSLRGSMEGDQQFCESTLKVLQETSTLLVEQAIAAAEAAEDGQHEGDAMVSVLWSTGANQASEIQVDVHVCPMPQLKSRTSNVLIHGDARSNPECKHSQWIADRVPLEKHQSDVATAQSIDLHESILSAAEDCGDRVLLEGFITNLFVVQSGRIHTSPDRVLAGSTREMVLRACESLGIPVVFEAPRLSQIASWDAAFLTSAVRIVVPIARVLWHPRGDAVAPLQSHTLDAEACEPSLLQPLRDRICDLWQSC